MPFRPPFPLHLQPEPHHYSDPLAWVIDGILPVRHIWDRIECYHIRPLTSLFHATGVPLVPSMRSCYRSRAYELSRGRSGSSLHTFPGATRGACDLLRADGVDVASVLDLLVERGPWRRICHYPNNGFIHVDYGDVQGRICDHRQLFTCSGPVLPWVRVRWLPEPVTAMR